VRVCAKTEVIFFPVFCDKTISIRGGHCRIGRGPILTEIHLLVVLTPIHCQVWTL
jgi:hypothetical protein